MTETEAWRSEEARLLAAIVTAGGDRRLPRINPDEWIARCVRGPDGIVEEEYVETYPESVAHAVRSTAMAGGYVFAILPDRRVRIVGRGRTTPELALVGLLHEVACQLRGHVSPFRAFRLLAGVAVWAFRLPTPARANDVDRILREGLRA